VRPSEVKDTWCQTAADVCSALTLVCKQALEGRLKLKEQCIVIFPSLAHKTLPFVMPYNKRREIPESDEVLIREEGLGLESRGEKGLANTTERCSVGEKE